MQQPVYLFQHPCKRLQTIGETTIDYYLLPLLRKEGPGVVDKGKVGGGFLFVHSMHSNKTGSVQTHWVVLRYLCTACLPYACDYKPKKRQENSEFWRAENRAEVIRRMIAGKYASFDPLSASCWQWDFWTNTPASDFHFIFFRTSNDRLLDCN